MTEHKIIERIVLIKSYFIKLEYVHIFFRNYFNVCAFQRILARLRDFNNFKFC